MIVHALARRSWVNALATIWLGSLLIAPLAQAEESCSILDHDAIAVSLNDQMIQDEMSQVEFLDYEWYDEDSSCDACDACGHATTVCCCKPWWAHRCGVFADFLLLRPGSADQIYSIEQNSPVPGDFPTGPVGRVNIDDSTGYRVGFTLAASDCTSLIASYTRVDGNTANTIYAQPGNVLNSQIIHPSSLTTGASSLQSSAASSFNFDLIDLGYHHVLKSSECYVVNWLAGFRYGQMEQDLVTQQEVSVATGLVTNDIDVDFNGFGLSLGLDGERRSPCSGLMVYGRGLSSFLAGDWKGSYVQTNQFGGGVIANAYEDYRVTPVLELELGLGWRSPCGRCRASVGYLTSAWYDAVSTRTYVESVRAGNYVSVNDTITFSGLTAGLEANF